MFFYCKHYTKKALGDFCWIILAHSFIFDKKKSMNANTIHLDAKKKFSLKGHLGSHKVTFYFTVSLCLRQLIWSKLYTNANIIKTYFFHIKKEYLRGHKRLHRKILANYFTFRFSDLIITLTYALMNNFFPSHGWI